MPGPLASMVSQYALPFSTGMGSLQNQTPSLPAMVSYLSPTVGVFFGASLAVALPWAIFDPPVVAFLLVNVAVELDDFAVLGVGVLDPVAGQAVHGLPAGRRAVAGLEIAVGDEVDRRLSWPAACPAAAASAASPDGHGRRREKPGRSHGKYPLSHFFSFSIAFFVNSSLMPTATSLASSCLASSFLAQLVQRLGQQPAGLRLERRPGRDADGAVR